VRQPRRRRRQLHAMHRRPDADRRAAVGEKRESEDRRERSRPARTPKARRSRTATS
jgi:hypothetical protein